MKNRMQGFKLFDKWVKNAAYADDVRLFVDGTENDLKEDSAKLDTYGKPLGLKLSSSKCTILRV